MSPGSGEKDSTRSFGHPETAGGSSRSISSWSWWSEDGDANEERQRRVVRELENTEPPIKKNTHKQKNRIGMLFFSPNFTNNTVRSVIHFSSSMSSNLIHAGESLEEYTELPSSRLETRRSLVRWNGHSFFGILGPWRMLEIGCQAGDSNKFSRGFGKGFKLPWYRIGCSFFFGGPGLEKMSFWKLWAWSWLVWLIGIAEDFTTFDEDASKGDVPFPCVC